MVVTRERIIEAIVEGSGRPRKEAREALEKLIEILKTTLAAEEDVLVSGFGKFIVKRKRARRGRNPQTREALELRPRRVVVFHPSGKLRRKMNGTETVEIRIGLQKWRKTLQERFASGRLPALGALRY